MISSDGTAVLYTDHSSSSSVVSPAGTDSVPIDVIFPWKVTVYTEENVTCTDYSFLFAVEDLQQHVDQLGLDQSQSNSAPGSSHSALLGGWCRNDFENHSFYSEKLFYLKDFHSELLNFILKYI